eukprot:scaffold33817_cov78-Phaeocystis_antarctica.AAC.2
MGQRGERAKATTQTHPRKVQVIVAHPTWNVAASRDVGDVARTQGCLRQELGDAATRERESLLCFMASVCRPYLYLSIRTHNSAFLLTNPLPRPRHRDARGTVRGTALCTARMFLLGPFAPHPPSLARPVSRQGTVQGPPHPDHPGLGARAPEDVPYERARHCIERAQLLGDGLVEGGVARAELAQQILENALVLQVWYRKGASAQALAGASGGTTAPHGELSGSGDPL